MDASAAYNKRVSTNDHGSGYSGSYIYDMVIWGGSEYDVRDYRNYWVKGKEGMQQNWYDDSWYDNPWFKAYEITDAYDIDVVNAALNASYEITPWLKAMVRSGVDVYTKRNEWKIRSLLIRPGIKRILWSKPWYGYEHKHRRYVNGR